MRSIVRVSLLSLCIAAGAGCKKKPEADASKGSAAGSGSAMAGSDMAKGSDTPAGSGSDMAGSAAAGSGSAADTGSAGAKTLYDRLGGQAGVAAIVDENFKNVTADKRINKRFEKVDIVELKKKINDLICMATKGPCQYKGLPVGDAHKGMKITEADFAAFAEDFGKALDAKGVQKAEKDELFALIGPLKADVVGH